MSEDIKKSFSQLASEYDEVVVKLVPHYTFMLETAAQAAQQHNSKTLKILELGSGTGNMTSLLIKAFPQAQIDCVDLVGDMLSIAQDRLKEQDNIRFHECDYLTYEFEKDYDLVITALAFHHIKQGDDKLILFKKISECLKPCGLFCNADVVFGANDSMQAYNIERWKEFMRQNISDDEIENKWLPRYYEKDHPFPVLQETQWLQEAGFTHVDLLWKYFTVAVYAAVK